ncbi:hypothetical protein VNO78_28669 [Psophocarpus tetragonolobus]|uniref:NAD-dependent epimerase/dehydratase domain-containing protein n=1 Tax=Psophocarpus tetragonolobus TaxID=3891 RepID=A0AAN9RTX5_PSOTE
MEIALSIPHLRGHVHVGTSLGSITPTLSEKRSMFILGMGFVGQSFARKLQNQGWVVSGTCTSHAKKKQLQDMGFHVQLFDANHPNLDILQILKNYTHILVSIPPLLGIGDPMLRHEDLIGSSLINGDLQWLCYLSSTSVYGDCDGELVNEDYPTNPESELAILRLASEKGWSNLTNNLGKSPLLFRLGGIYGPGRSAVDTIIKQKSLSERQKRRKHRKYTSRVHVEDICQALMATLYAPSPREVYNIVDDDPAPREEVFEYAMKLVEEKWPELKLQSVEQRSNVNPRGDKRVCNARMKSELGVQLLYPDYRSGLKSIIHHIQTPFHCH